MRSRKEIEQRIRMFRQNALLKGRDAGHHISPLMGRRLAKEAETCKRGAELLNWVLEGDNFLTYRVDSALELPAFRPGAVILTSYGDVLMLGGEGKWLRPGITEPVDALSGFWLPLTVLSEGAKRR